MDKKKRTNKRRKRQMINIVMTVSLIVVMASGILLHPLRGVMLMKLLHTLSSLTLTASIVVHVVQHWGGKKRVAGDRQRAEGELDVS